MTVERVADFLIRKLHEAGVNHVFLVTGRGILFLSDAVARQKEMQAVPAYHEQGASFAAMAYAQAGGGLGACLVSTGCAATNAVTAALCAWQDSVPVVFLSGQHMLHETTHFTRLPIRTYGSQEADIIEMVRPITKYAVMLTDAQQVAAEFEKAVFFALEGRRGPVWIDVPLDVQNMRIDAESLPHFHPENVSVLSVPAPRFGRQMDAVAQAIAGAKRPLLLAGGGTRRAAGDVAEIAEQYHLPVVFSPAAADVYGAGHALSIGAVGSLGGSRAGNFALQNADVVLAVGTKLCSQMTGSVAESFAREAKVIVADLSPEEHLKEGEPLDAFVRADAGVFLRALSERLPAGYRVPEAWEERCQHWKQAFSLQEEPFLQELEAADVCDLYGLADLLNACLPEDATILTDAGFEELILPSSLRLCEGQRCLFPAAQGAMGYAIPAILGAYFAGRKHLACIVGDGSIMMNLQELQTIQQNHVPVKILVISNDMYAVIRKRQHDLFRRRTIGTGREDGVSAPDFSQVAQAFGFPYRKLETLSEVRTQLPGILSDEGALLCEIVCTPEQKYLHQSYALNEKRRLEIRPLEDLSPFMEREKLEREMEIPLWKQGEGEE